MLIVQRSMLKKLSVLKNRFGPKSKRVYVEGPIPRPYYMNSTNATTFKLCFEEWSELVDAELVSLGTIEFPNHTTSKEMVISGVDVRFPDKIILPTKVYEHIVSEAKKVNAYVSNSPSTESIPIRAIPHAELGKGIEVQQGRGLVGYKTLFSRDTHDVNILGRIGLVDSRKGVYDLCFSVIYAEIKHPEEYTKVYETDRDFRDANALEEEKN